MRNTFSLYILLFFLIVATLVSALVVNVVVIQYGITNDYIFVNLQDISEELEDRGLYTNTFNVSNLTLFIAESYQDTINWLDNIWFMTYIIFILITFYIAYEIKVPTDMNFFMVLLYGNFIFLFVAYLSDIFVVWFTNQVTLQLMPNVLEFFPKYSWYVNNIGLINLVHGILLILISRLNFQHTQRDNINKQEIDSLDEGEIN